MVVHGCTRLYMVVRGCTWLYKVVQLCKLFYKVVKHCKPYKMLFKVIQGYTQLYKCVQGFTRLQGRCTILLKIVKQLYTVVRGCTWLYNLLNLVKGCTMLYINCRIVIHFLCIFGQSLKESERTIGVPERNLEVFGEHNVIHLHHLSL